MIAGIQQENPKTTLQTDLGAKSSYNPYETIKDTPTHIQQLSKKIHLIHSSKHKASGMDHSSSLSPSRGLRQDSGDDVVFSPEIVRTKKGAGANVTQTASRSKLSVMRSSNSLSNLGIQGMNNSHNVAQSMQIRQFITRNTKLKLQTAHNQGQS